MSDKFIELTGVDEIKKELERIKTKGESMQPVMAEIGNQLKNTSERSFELSRSPSGEVWKKLAVNTLTKSYGKKTTTKKGKATKGFERYVSKRKILVKSGLLSKLKVKANSKSVSIGSDRPYAAIHQFGGMAGRGRKVKIPARPYLPIDKEGKLNDIIKVEVLEMLKKWFEK